MKELSRAEATELVATKVMGWEYHGRKEAWWYTDADGERVATNKKTLTIPYYNPFADDQLHRCFEALEKWKKTVRESAEIEYTGTWCVRLYDGFAMVSIAGAKSLNVAIITALCSAVLGESVIIKEEV